MLLPGRFLLLLCITMSPCIQPCTSIASLARPDVPTLRRVDVYAVSRSRKMHTRRDGRGQVLYGRDLAPLPRPAQPLCDRWTLASVSRLANRCQRDTGAVQRLTYSARVALGREEIPPFIRSRTRGRGTVSCCSKVEERVAHGRRIVLDPRIYSQN